MPIVIDFGSHTIKAVIFKASRHHQNIFLLQPLPARLTLVARLNKNPIINYIAPDQIEMALGPIA